MKFQKILILPLVLAVSGCSAATIDRCAGWESILVAGPTIEYLDANDRKALAGLIAHHEFGKANGCWE